jgi:DNA-binding transcriptional regulator YiaG
VSGNDAFASLMEEARHLSGEEFVRMMEGGRRIPAAELVSIKDLAAELGVSVRILRRWNRRPDAPKRLKRGRQLMYVRADVARWVEHVRRAG